MNSGTKLHLVFLLGIFFFIFKEGYGFWILLSCNKCFFIKSLFLAGNQNVFVIRTTHMGTFNIWYKKNFKVLSKASYKVYIQYIT